MREQERLAELGYVVLATDLRSFGGSEVDPATGTDLDIGPTLDVINAARAVAADGRVDPTRVALVGHSLGGLIVLNASVVAPDVAAAVVAVAPSSTDVWQNIEQFLVPGDPAWEAVVTPHGTITDNPDFWADVTPRTFVDRAAAPLLIVQGSADDVVAPEWSTDTEAVWRHAGKEVALVTIDGADHVLDPHWDQAMIAIETFLAEELE